MCFLNLKFLLNVCQLVCLQEVNWLERVGTAIPLHCLCLSLYVKVSGFNERTAEVRRVRGLHLPDRRHDSEPAVSMLILAGAP